MLIGGTYYAGEIKKSIFTLMNDRLPLRGVMPMHCSANVGEDGRVAMFFGLSGTGKTTLSADPERHLIGDDEHGWSDDGHLQLRRWLLREGDPTLDRGRAGDLPRRRSTFGTVLENVVVDERGVLDLDDDSKTENTRAAYKLEQIPNHLPTKRAGHPTLGRHADRGRVRRPAADRAADAGAGAVLLPLGLHGEGGRHRDRRHGAAGDVLHLLRRAVPTAAARPCTRGCSASGSRRTARRSGS